ncbi:MAG: ribulose-bisphosphate carboxylase large subunit family protein [Opitutales bacterium]
MADTDDRVFATYRLESPGDPEAAATALAGEQSSGTFVPVPGETPALKARFAARVEAVEPLDPADRPSLPGGAGTEGPCHRARVRISWPVGNFPEDIPALWAAVLGNLFEMRQVTGLKLEALDLPAFLTDRYRGPRFGASGTRHLAGVPDNRPLIGTIIKPSVGLTPEATADLVQTLAEAGLDFVKDDELMVSTANAAFRQRVEHVMAVVNREADRTGRQIMVAFNLSGTLEVMKRRYETIVEAGGTCAMLNLNAVGWSGVHEVCRWGQLAVHGHRNGWGMLTRHPWLGMDFSAYQAFWRLAGVDHLHVNGLANKFWEPDASVVRSIRACSTPLGNLGPLLPVVSSGQWGGQAFDTWRQTGTTDLLYLAGGGIHAHPDGPGAGVQAIRQAWQAAVDGLDPNAAADRYPAFRRSRETFGNPAS